MMITDIDPNTITIFQLRRSGLNNIKRLALYSLSTIPNQILNESEDEYLKRLSIHIYYELKTWYPLDFDSLSS